MQELNDSIILEQYLSLCTSHRTKNYLSIHFPELYNYLINRFNDIQENDSLGEIIYRIKNKLEEKPKCNCCKNNYVKFKFSYYKKYCEECYLNGDINKCISLQTQKTMLDKYGVKSYLSLKDIHDLAINEKPMQKKKTTWLKKYGVDNPLKIKENQLKCTSEQSKQKKKQTLLQHYGVDHNFKISSCIKNSHSYEASLKRQQTCLQKYGVLFSCLSKNADIARKLFLSNIQKVNEANLKRQQTCLEKYGTELYVNTQDFKNKTINTNILKYGVDNPMKNKEFYNKWLQIMHLKMDEINNKRYLTKKQNNSFSSSKIEKKFYNYLLNEFSEDDIYTQYKSEKYPFCCDFYIKSLDLYIEIQGFISHGLHAFDKNNLNDVSLLNKWQQLSSDFYKKCALNWSVVDVNKRDIARKNNLNYLEIFSCDINECKMLFNKYINENFNLNVTK